MACGSTCCGERCDRLDDLPGQVLVVSQVEVCEGCEAAGACVGQ